MPLGLIMTRTNVGLQERINQTTASLTTRNLARIRSRFYLARKTLPVQYTSAILPAMIVPQPFQYQGGKRVLSLMLCPNLPSSTNLYKSF